MFEKAIILGLYSITPVHAGSGAEMSVIDLPIQRERHTGFPVIWGQSLKGVLRRAYEKLNGSEKTEIIFGPPTDRAHEHAGSISVGDAKILLFPVRSLKGVFAYVTCPMALRRLLRDFELVKRNEKIDVLTVDEESAIVEQNSVLVVDDKVVIEDITLDAKKSKTIQKISEILSKISPVEIDSKRVSIISDDLFAEIVQTATEIVARVRIKAETGTVESGGLWYEEYLPSDSLLYSVIAIGKPKKPVNGLSTADDVANALRVFNGKFVQVGGNETVGKGFVKLKVM